MAKDKKNKKKRSKATRVILTCDRAYLNELRPEGTVECYYSDVDMFYSVPNRPRIKLNAPIVKGTKHTLSTDSAFSNIGNAQNLAEPDLDAIAVSGVTPIVIGGILSLLGCKPAIPHFWKTIQRLDEADGYRIGSVLNTASVGLSRLESEILCKRVLTFLGFVASLKFPVPADDITHLDITDTIRHARHVLEELASENYIDEHATLNIDEYRLTFIENDQLDRVISAYRSFQHVLLRVSNRDVTHFFEHGNCIYPVVVQYNPENNRITIERYSDDIDIDCERVIRVIDDGSTSDDEGLAVTSIINRASLSDAIRLARIADVVMAEDSYDLD